MNTSLPWPREWAFDRSGASAWAHAGSNLCLDFHGDPATAKVVVFSDGNHHMALADTLARFREQNPAVHDVFYATTPPAVLVNALEMGGLNLGNLHLSAKPHVFISPPAVLETLRSRGHITAHEPFMRSRGNVLLVQAGNPLGVESASDLAREDVRLFLSNPITETASYRVYAETLRGYGAQHGVVFDFLEEASTLAGRAAADSRIVFGERIHHREAPAAIAADQADAAVLYYHLALRYTRVFPGHFEIVTLDGAATPEPAPADWNQTTTYHLGLVGDGGEWGPTLREFLLSDEVQTLYAHHGLIHPSP